MITNTERSFENMTSEQKEVLMAYVNFFLQSKYKERLVAKFKTIEIQALASISTAVSFVSKRLLEKVKNEPEFQQILDLLKLSQTKKEIASELLIIYEAKKGNALNRLKGIFEKLRYEILGKQEQNYLALQNSADESKRKLSQKILENAIASCVDNKLVEQYQRLKIEIEILASNLDFELTPAIFAFESKDFNIIEYLAFLVYKPEHRLMSEIYLDPQWEKFPLKWANHLGLADTKTLFDMFKDGENISPFYLSRFEVKGINAIRELASDPIARTPIAKNYQEIQDAIRQALLCYENKWYTAFLYTVMPIIEGILWNYSSYVHAIGEAKIYAATNSTSIINLSGKIVSCPTVGTLLRDSEFSKFFDLEFIQYFCDELYNERNPMLHGRSFSQVTMENATKKLATLEYLFVAMKTMVEGKIISNFEKLPSDSIETLIETFTENHSTI